MVLVPSTMGSIVQLEANHPLFFESSMQRPIVGIAYGAWKDIPERVAKKLAARFTENLGGLFVNEGETPLPVEAYHLVLYACKNGLKSLGRGLPGSGILHCDSAFVHRPNVPESNVPAGDAAAAGLRLAKKLGVQPNAEMRKVKRNCGS
jgi:hypothetical protein